jgi:5-(carboxyamino)imidazole ribonucleotide synthase
MTIGIAGAGQLGRMLGQAAIPLGMSCEFLDRQACSPAARVGSVRIGSLDDAEALVALGRSVDVLTPEIENVSIEGLTAARAHCPVYPPPEAVAAAQDRLDEKRLFASLGIPTAPYTEVSTQGDLEGAASALGWPIVLKARRLGYDGRGQRLAHSRAELEQAWQDLRCVPAIAEGWVKFANEVSLIGVRGSNGDVAFYPLSENTHDNGILKTTVAPFADQRLQEQAEDWLTAIMGHFGYRGVLTVEFFRTESGLVANEMAPRVHNSGHWTIEGAETSQFENHIRAVAGLPLGDTSLRGHAAMMNLIGAVPDRSLLLSEPGVHLHDYGKAPRSGRKVGHCTLVDRSRSRLISRLNRLRERIRGKNP